MSKYSYSNGMRLPSYLGVQDMGATAASSAHDGTFQLLLGEVKEVIPASSPKSLSKRYLEYNVEVQHREDGGPTSTVMFANCLLINSLAGVADKEYYTLRSDPKEPKKDEVATTGAKVLLLCVNGNAGSAFIIGGIREDSGGDVNDHRYFFEFNGVQQTINKDGELQIRYRGATKVDGTLTDDANAEAEGSTIIFNKDGGIKLYTKDEAQYVFLDHANKKLEVLADEEWNVAVNKKLIFSVGDSIAVTGQKGCSIEVVDNIVMKSAGVLVGDATDYWLLANKYRDAETKMLKEISSQMQSIMGLITEAAASLTTASTANAPPIVGGAAAATPFAAAATALNKAAPKFAQVSAAIDAFEARASTYLSKKNKND